MAHNMTTGKRISFARTFCILAYGWEYRIPLGLWQQSAVVFTTFPMKNISQRKYHQISSYQTRNVDLSIIHRNNFPQTNPLVRTSCSVINNGYMYGVRSNSTFKNTTKGSVSGKRTDSIQEFDVKCGDNEKKCLSPTKLTGQETFGNYQVAYGRKSVFELLRILSFFFLCRFSFATDNAVKIMEILYKILGTRLAETMIRKLIYDQFVAGVSVHEIKMAALKLRQGGVASILCVPIETDDRIVDRDSSKDTFFDTNLQKVVASIHLAAELGNTFPMTQFRISALMAGDLMKTVSPLCAQTTHDPEVMNALMAAMSGQDTNFSKLPGWEPFPTECNGEFMKGIQRLGIIKEALQVSEIIALVDAEYTCVNPALRLLALCLMKACNSQTTKVFYTYQAYLKQTLKNLQEDLVYASAHGFGLGVKLVRGAYMVSERKLARDLGHDDPVNETFDLTSVSYHNCLDILLEQVARKQPTRFMIASHNEDTMLHAIARMNELGIPKDGSSVFFGQLYGMADHISFTLGHNGYRVYKSIPYGTILETLPYLARRAQENKSILLNARRERKLVAQALVDRILIRA